MLLLKVRFRVLCRISHFLHYFLDARLYSCCIATPITTKEWGIFRIFRLFSIINLSFKSKKDFGSLLLLLFITLVEGYELTATCYCKWNDWDLFVVHNPWRVLLTDCSLSFKSKKVFGLIVVDVVQNKSLICRQVSSWCLLC